MSQDNTPPPHHWYAPGNAAPPPSSPPPAGQRIEPELPDKLDLRSLFEALLRSPRAVVRRLATPGHGAFVPFLEIAILSLVVFGAVLGSFA
ncbi:hypothetical protein L9G15_23385, partial [Shewanella sp. A3A]|nr:hypothetical protein [Shewanella ferrihydritica]